MKKRIRKLFLFGFLLLAISAINFSSCKDTVEPQLTNGPWDDYTWTVDTIKYPGSFQTSMKTIWGNANNDIWIAGHNNRGRGKAFYFNGTEWKDFLPVVPTIFNTYNFSTSLNLGDETFLCGTAHYFINDTILHIKDSSLILSYEENQWSIAQLGEAGPIQTISGSKNGKLYAAGWDLTLFVYENNIWEKEKLNLNIPQFYETKSISGILVDEQQQGYMFVFCYNGNPYIEKKYFVKEENNRWIVVDSINSTTTIAKFGVEFWESNDGTIYSFNPGVFSYTGSSWSNLWNKSELITTMKTTSDGSIFAAGRGVYHFDGHKWTENEEFYNKLGLAKDILILKDTILFLFSNSNSSFVLRGYK